MTDTDDDDAVWEDIFDDIKATPALIHAVLPQYAFDPVAKTRLEDDHGQGQPLQRTSFQAGPKTMSLSESDLRAMTFLQAHQADWSADFRDRLLTGGLTQASVDAFISFFAKTWTDGRRDRQSSPYAIALKAALRAYAYSILRHKGVYVAAPADVSANPSTRPCLTPDEIAVIYEANTGMTQTYLADYIDALDGDLISSLSDLMARRGIFMQPSFHPHLVEQNYLSSYSMALGPVEQFAQTWTPQSRATGVPCIFSVPFSTLQPRIVAFAPFIDGMDLSQMEIVTAPPLRALKIRHHGLHGGIEEYQVD